uniref:BCCT family transporter n=1 Tax=Acinetobacter baumannii TaxID=470 RepID=UPI00147AC4D3
TAGMGIGLTVSGVAEPAMHYVNPSSGEPHPLAATQQALPVTLFHSCLHAGAISAVVRLASASLAYRHTLPL